MYNPIHSPATTEKTFFFHLAKGLVVNLDLLKGSSFDGVRNLRSSLFMIIINAN